MKIILLLNCNLKFPSFKSLKCPIFAFAVRVLASGMQFLLGRPRWTTWVTLANRNASFYTRATWFRKCAFCFHAVLVIARKVIRNKKLTNCLVNKGHTFRWKCPLVSSLHIYHRLGRVTAYVNKVRNQVTNWRWKNCLDCYPDKIKVLWLKPNLYQKLRDERWMCWMWNKL